MFWTDGDNGQHAIPVTWGSRPHVIFVDEQAQGAVRIIDIGEETAPRVVTNIRLEIHLPEHADAREADSAGWAAASCGCIARTTGSWCCGSPTARIPCDDNWPACGQAVPTAAT